MNDKTIAAQLRAFAARIESSPTDRAAIAGGFRLIAEALDPAPQTIEPEDNPEAGTGPDLVDTVTGPGLEA
jgi:hypothetical protein